MIPSFGGIKVSGGIHRNTIKGSQLRQYSRPPVPRKAIDSDSGNCADKTIGVDPANSIVISITKIDIS
jgi:hypothetical protein